MQGIWFRLSWEQADEWSDNRPVGKKGPSQPGDGPVLRAPAPVATAVAIGGGLPSIFRRRCPTAEVHPAAKMLGFSLEEVRELLALRVSSLDTCRKVRERTQTKILDIEQKIYALQQMKRVLSDLVTACSRRRKTEECPVLDCLERHGDPV